MDDNSCLRKAISGKLVDKANMQSKVYDNTFAVFNHLKELLHEMSSEMNDELDDKLEKRVRIEYRDRGKFEAQLQIGTDVLIFNMHTNIFEFDQNHLIWNNSYVKNDIFNSYCGIINIYNFLSDLFKYNRNSDEGYMIGRLFVNRNMHYFVEGKGQDRIRHNNFGDEPIDREALLNVIESAANYALDFDLLVPPYDAVKTVTVDQMNTKFENSKMVTGKRLNYVFNTDDI